MRVGPILIAPGCNGQITNESPGSGDYDRETSTGDGTQCPKTEYGSKFDLFTHTHRRGIQYIAVNVAISEPAVPAYSAITLQEAVLAAIASVRDDRRRLYPSTDPFEGVRPHNCW